jgi:hypothetical protein
VSSAAAGSWRRSGRDGVWWGGLVVASAAAAATAHGLYAVAAASGVPAPVAVLYPVMTDGLALVAYSATNRLTERPRRYAWTVVITAAGLSGAAQAVYLAGGGVNAAPSGVRFGVGAAPALAAAAVAHLLHLLRTAARGAVQLNRAIQPSVTERAGPECRADGAMPADPTARHPVGSSTPTLTAPGAAARARASALRHRDQHGRLPTTSELVRLADVSRGTAGTVLKGLRTAPARPDRSSSTSDRQPTRLPSKIQNDHTPMHHDPQEDPLRNGIAVPGIPS